VRCKIGGEATTLEEAAMSLFKELNHVSITVTDVAKAREFYGNVLGFKEIPRPAFNFPGHLVRPQ
jgi:extradiol dioxygenase family protein